MEGRAVRRPGNGTATVVVDRGEVLVAFRHKGRAVIATRSHGGTGGVSDAEVLGLIDVVIKVAKL